jgi:hypothetical protein
MDALFTSRRVANVTSHMGWLADVSGAAGSRLTRAELRAQVLFEAFRFHGRPPMGAVRSQRRVGSPSRV